MSMDLVGHGLSSHRPPGAFYSFLDYVADVHRVVDGVCLCVWLQKVIYPQDYSAISLVS